MADNPFPCRERAELQPPARIHNFKSHLIVYRQLGDAIAIICTLNESFDVEDRIE
ncbi:hypothetical protein [uncultured Cycloclasticus sp.]|uniref:hypothetical protein n=1 Tax=uncultured Cycloclasticus sp. TaxID=172194 RepID=UPI0025880B41|nr:hypothetical protein [uncultured Cycloclasticus sp.]